ncbi:MAG TPA: alpha/beta hydrolase, partial [Rhizobiales bacterium]|nr:alpha/beta hydrolase [Hyphomicrobiales bacterium]
SLLMSDQYRNTEHVAKVTAPLLVLHGEQDEVIPAAMGRRVYAAANEPKKLEIFPRGHHSDLFDHGAWERVRAFLAGLPAGS